MLATDLDLLVRNAGWPSVSVLCGADRADWDGLRRDAADRLDEAVGDRWADRILASLDRVGDALDGGNWPSVGVFANDDFAHAVSLPQPVRPRVVIDATFATRDLVVGMTRTPRYLVLTLDGGGAQLWSGLGQRLAPAPSAGRFPLQFPAAPAPEERRQKREPSQVRDAHIDRCHRDLDQALSRAVSAQDQRPVFVVGDQRRIHRFVEASHLSGRVTALVAGPATAPGPELAALIAPELQADRAIRADRAIESVGSGIGANRFAAGIVEVWDLAHEGRVELLAVEEDYDCSASIDADTGAIEPIDAPTPGGIDDAVDEIIEAVLAAGGDVEVVAPGAIEDWDHIAARLRH